MAVSCSHFHVTEQASNIGFSLSDARGHSKASFSEKGSHRKIVSLRRAETDIAQLILGSAIRLQIKSPTESGARTPSRVKPNSYLAVSSR